MKLPGRPRPGQSHSLVTVMGAMTGEAGKAHDGEHHPSVIEARHSGPQEHLNGPTPAFVAGRRRTSRRGRRKRNASERGVGQRRLVMGAMTGRQRRAHDCDHSRSPSRPGTLAHGNTSHGPAPASSLGGGRRSGEGDASERLRARGGPMPPRHGCYDGQAEAGTGRRPLTITIAARHIGPREHLPWGQRLRSSPGGGG